MGKKEIAEFGRQVRGLRKSRGLTLEDLGEKSGLHEKFIGEIERGRSDLMISSALKIASGLSLSPAEFFSLIYPHEALIPEGREVLDLVISTLRKKDRKKLQKLKTFLKDIL